MKKNNKGFTLIELLVVIAIIGLLSTLAVVSLNTARQRARDARRQSDMKQISTAMELYFSENEDYPVNGAACAVAGIISEAETAGLDALCTTAGDGIFDAAGNTFLNQIPADPGSNTYIYEGSATTYCISATLEGGGFFTCANGSCFPNAANCPNI